MSCCSPRSRGRDGERGAIAVMTALLVTAFLMVAALVVDLGYVRYRAMKDQTAADLAVLASGTNLAAGRPALACVDAVNSLKTNLPALGDLDGSSVCAPIPATACVGSPTMPATVSTTTRGYVITLQYPVPDGEIADPHFGAGLRDGPVCQRMRISVTSTPPVFFGAIAGRSSYSITRSATVHASYTSDAKIPALWLLDPFGCTTLAVTGGSRLTIGSPATPGIVISDSDGSTCTGGQRTVSSTGSGTIAEAVPTTGTNPGTIQLHALPPMALTCSGYACDASDVSSGRLSPQPSPLTARVTRLPADWRYNCRSGYPAYHTLPIASCPLNTPPYVELLAGAVGASGNPGGFQQWTATGHSCNPSGTITVTGNWWIDCPAGLRIGNGSNVTFTGGNLVLDGGINMTGGSLNLNTSNPNPHLPVSCQAPHVTTPCTDESSTQAAFAYIRNGSVTLTGGQLNSHHVATFVPAGYVSVAGGAPPTWLAPTEGPFQGLALWSELATNKFQINGGAGASLQGTFFTPEAAPFTLSGSSNWGQQNAQFITNQLVVSGGGALTLAPNPTAIALPRKTVRLIR